MASVKPFRNPSGEVVWRVQYRDAGKPRQETFRGDSAEVAAHEYAALIERFDVKTARDVLRRRTTGRSTGPTLREFTTRFLDPASGLLTGVTEQTRVDYARSAQGFLPILGDLPVDAITKTDVGRWIVWQERQPSRQSGTIAAGTVRKRHTLLSSILRVAVEQGLRHDNPAARAKLTRGTRRDGVFLSADEFFVLLRFIPEHYRSLIVFLAGTGCRFGEATAVQWGDLDLRATPPTVRIQRAWKSDGHGNYKLGVPKSVKSLRTVSLPPDVVAALPPATSGFVFRSVTGRQILNSNFNVKVWRPAVAAANDAERCAELGVLPIGKRPRVHDLRHTHVSWLIAGGAPLPFVQARLGHEKIDTTVGVYGHLLPDAHAEMARIIGNAMRSNSERALEHYTGEA